MYTATALYFRIKHLVPWMMVQGARDGMEKDVGGESAREGQGKREDQIL